MNNDLVRSMKSETSEVKYEHLSAIAFHILAIPASNVDCASVRPGGVEDQNRFLV